MESNVPQLQKHEESYGSSKLQVTILASEWGSSKGGLSSINRELAIQLAKFSNVEVTFFLPTGKCSNEDKKAADSHGISILEAKRRPGCNELDWLRSPPENLGIDVVIGHGVKIGHQAQFICLSHKCKWVQIVHTDSEELGMYKCYEKPISTGEEKHRVEVELCQMADFVVAVGPKLTEAFRRYLSCCNKDVFEFTPGIFADFSSVQQDPVERKRYSVLVFGRGDAEDFKLKGFDIAARSVAALSDTLLYFVGVPDRKHEEIAKCFFDLGIPAHRLKVRSYLDSREDLKKLFCEVDLVLMPSRTEGFGLTGLEALSAGLPVIVSKNSGFGEALGSLPSGSFFVIDSEDPSAWTAAIKDMWNKDRKSQLDEVKALRGSYSERHSWSKQCKCLIEKMVKLLDGASSEPEITAQAVGTRELKQNKDFTGTPFESEITAQAVGDGGLKRNKEFTGFSPCAPPKMKRGIIEENEHEQPAGLDESVSFKPGTLSEDDVLLIAHELGPSWKMFGRVLKVPDTVIDQIEADESKVSDKCYSVLRRWQERYPSDATYHCLALALQHAAVGRVDVAVKYCSLQLGTSSEPEITAQAMEAREQKGNKDFTGLFSCVPPKGKTGGEKNETEQPAARTSCPSHVIEWVREVCQKREGVISPVPWCEEFSFQVQDIFTRLRIVAKEKTRGIVTSKEVTNMTSILTPHEGCKQPLIALIDGEPGMGKTNYCQNLVYDWASKQCHEREESFPRIDVLLLLRCREIKSTIWDAIEDRRQLFFQFLKENPSKLLPVLDVLDEVDPQKLEIYLELIQKEELPGCYIVLTSRHEGGSRVRPYTDTLLEIVGFTTTDVESYIRSYFKQDKAHLAEALVSKVESDGDLRELTQNPLNALLLCAIFEYLEGVLPSNRTQLYVEIVVFILRRYESKNGLSNRDKDLLLVYKKELMILGRTALDSLRKHELHFDDHKGEIKESLLMKFGLLSIQSGGSKRAPCDRYGFFHKSFQEFFSGYYLAFSIIDDVTNFHSVLTDARYMGELFHVFKFMSGIVAQQSEETAVSIVQSIASLENETGPVSHSFYPKVAHYLINECKTCSGDLGTKLVRTFGESLKLVDVVVGYICNERDKGVFRTFLQALIFNSTVSNLRFLNLRFSEAVNLLAQALRVNSTLSSLHLVIGAEGATSLAQALGENASLSSLHLSGNSIGGEGANSLAEGLRVNTTLSSLDLTHSSIGDEGANSLAQALRVNTSLSSLDLRSNSIGAKGANTLAEALRVNSSLSSLNLFENSIGARGANSLAEALGVNSSLSSLNLSQNSIGARGANSLAEALGVNSSLSSLNLSQNSIGARGANSLAEALGVNSSLSSLNLSQNSIGARGANSLAQALRVNISLSSLDLSRNSIGDEGANSLAEALRVNISLSSLDLSRSSIGAEGGNSLALSLGVNSSLSSLNLYCNFIDDEGANSLAQALRVNTSLSSLDLGNNSPAQALRENTLSSLYMAFDSIGAETPNTPADALRVKSSLSLSLFSNSIGDEGTNSLAQALRVNSSLSSLSLFYNSIGAEGANSLAQALRGNTSLSSLDLSRNSIGDEGANSLAEALRVNTSLSSLNLHDNSIGAEGANSLAQALRVNTSLSSLDLNSNSIGAKVANTFAQALRVNTSLSFLDLRYTSIGTDGANSLDHYIRVNPFRSSLDFRFNSDLWLIRRVLK